MPPSDTPYVFRESPDDDPDDAPDGATDDELVIVEGRATWYRRYRNRS